MALILLSQSPNLETEYAGAIRQCEKNYRACQRRDELASLVQAANQKRLAEEAEVRARAAEAERVKSEQLQADEEKAEEARQSKLKQQCGRDYKRINVGMKFERFKRCSGLDADDFSVKAQDGSGTIYEVSGGSIRVERGTITKWIAGD